MALVVTAKCVSSSCSRLCNHRDPIGLIEAMQSQGVHDRRSSAKPRKRNGRRLRSVTCPTTRALPDKRKNVDTPVTDTIMFICV